MLIKEKKDYEFNLYNKLISFYQIITEDKASYLKRIIEKPIKG